MLGSYTVKVIKNMGPDAYMGLTVSQETGVNNWVNKGTVVN